MLLSTGVFKRTSSVGFANNLIFPVPIGAAAGLMISWFAIVLSSELMVFTRIFFGIVFLFSGAFLIKNFLSQLLKIVGFIFIVVAVGLLFSLADGIGREIILDALLITSFSAIVIASICLRPSFFKDIFARPFATVISMTATFALLSSLNLKLPSMLSWLLATLITWHIASNLKRAVKILSETDDIVDMAAEIFLQPFNWVLGAFKKVFR